MAREEEDRQRSKGGVKVEEEVKVKMEENGIIYRKGKKAQRYGPLPVP